MKRNVRFSTFLLSLLLCFGAFAGCGKKDKGPGETLEVQGSDAPTEEVSGEFVYNYPQMDCNETALRFYNLSEMWDMYVYLDAPATGDKLDKEVYNRNERIRDRFNCEIKIDTFQWISGLDAYVNSIEKDVINSMNSWDVIYFPINRRPDLITKGYFLDLESINYLQLDREWWDRELNDTFELSGKLYFASSPLQLQAFDSAWAIFFNQKLITDHEGMPDPRTLVQNNEWTIAKLDELCLEASNTNGATDFFYGDGNGGQIYGISAHHDLPDKMIYAAGERFVEKNSDGIPELAANGETFGTVVTNLAKLLGAQHNLHAASTDMVKNESAYWGNTAGYVYTFVNNRAYFMGGEVKSSRVIKQQDTDTSYGIVPLPKASSSQPEWYTPVVENLMVMTIPNTCTKIEMAGVILDAMSYESYAKVLPVYYDRLLYQGYTPQDKPIMEILRSSRGVDIAYFYGWNKDLVTDIKERIFDGTGEISGKLESEGEAITAKIGIWLESLQNIGKND